MTQKSAKTTPYVALKPLRMGAFSLRTGDPVPVIEGRNYPAMCRKGMIRDVTETGQPPLALSREMQESAVRSAENAAAALTAAPATPEPMTGAAHTHALAVPFVPGESVVYVSESGASALAKFLGLFPATDEIALALGVSVGEPAAHIECLDDQQFVRPADLLPEQPTRRLMADLTGEGEGQGADEPDGLEPVGVISLVIRAGEFAYHVAPDGMAERVFVVGETCFPASESEATEFGIETGEAMIRVQVTAPEDAESTDAVLKSVPAFSLLPEQPTERLAKEAEGLLALAMDATQPEAEGEGGGGEVQTETEDETGERWAALESERDYLSLVLEAIRAKGEEIPEGFPSRATLLNNGVRTIPGILLLAEGEGGMERLSALYSVSDKQAAKMLTALEALGHLKPAEAAQDGASGETSASGETAAPETGAQV